MTQILPNYATDPEVYPHHSGDLVLPIILDPAVAAQIQGISERWGQTRLSETVADLLLVGLISVNSTASTT